jgi:hypothetical protein
MHVPRFDFKGPDETVELTFDFSSELDAGENLIGPPILTIQTRLGTDLTPALTTVGTPSIDATGRLVLQTVSGGQLGSTYLLTMVCSTSNPNKVLDRNGLLPIAIG